MTGSIAPDEPPNSSKLSDRRLEQRSLSFDSSYLCPICRHGTITSMTLMDAFACDFCRHILTANLQQQFVRVEDSSAPMIWRWNGHTWQTLNQTDTDLAVIIWLVSLALVALPPTLIWLSAHTFPPLPHSPWAWVPGVWSVLALMCHLAFVSWLLMEHYQVPLYVALKVRLQGWLRLR